MRVVALPRCEHSASQQGAGTLKTDISASPSPMMMRVLRKSPRSGREVVVCPLTVLNGRHNNFARYQQTRSPYLRLFVIRGAWSSVAHLNRQPDRLENWLDQLDQRTHKKMLNVALANKITRMLRSRAHTPGTLAELIDPSYS